MKSMNKGKPHTVHSKPTCANCGIPIFWDATVVDGKHYCCLGCAQGGPCECDYGNLPDGERATAMILQHDQGYQGQQRV